MVRQTDTITLAKEDILMDRMNDDSLAATVNNPVGDPNNVEIRISLESSTSLINTS